jgi:hypothetical protein
MKMEVAGSYQKSVNMSQIFQRHTSENNLHITLRILHITKCVLFPSCGNTSIQVIAQEISCRFTPWRPAFGTNLRHVGFVVETWHFGGFYPSTSVSPATSHSTDCSTFLSHPIILAL